MQQSWLTYDALGEAHADTARILGDQEHRASQLGSVGSMLHAMQSSEEKPEDGSLDDALGEAYADDARILGDLPQHRERKALHACPQTANVLRERLGQHVDTPLHQVGGRRPAQAAKLRDSEGRGVSFSTTSLWPKADQPMLDMADIWYEACGTSACLAWTR